MTVRDDLSLLTPRLRRYARALVQAAPEPSEIADQLVHAALLRALDTAVAGPSSNVTLHVFAILTQLHRDMCQERKAHAAGAVRRTAARQEPTPFSPEPGRGGQNKGLLEALARLSLDEREALLIVAVEQFSYQQAMQILHVSRTSLIARLARARAQLAQALALRPELDKAAKRPPYLRVVK